MPYSLNGQQFWKRCKANLPSTATDPLFSSATKIRGFSSMPGKPTIVHAYDIYPGLKSKSYFITLLK